MLVTGEITNRRVAPSVFIPPITNISLSPFQ